MIHDFRDQTWGFFKLVTFYVYCPIDPNAAVCSLRDMLLDFRFTPVILNTTW